MLLSVSMREKYFILVILLIVNFKLTINNSFAQTYFDREYNISPLGDFICSFSDTSGYLAIGGLSKIDYKKMGFVRINTGGDTIWTKTYGQNNYLTGSSAGKCINIGDTNFVFVGAIFTDSISQSSDSSLIVLYKIDLDGNVLWEFNFGDNGKKNYPQDIQQTTDGGFIITGWTTGWGNTIYNSSFLLKVDVLGNEQWHKIYGGGSSTNQRDAFSVDLTDDNGYIFSGSFYQGLATRQDINVIKTDSLGNIIWNKIYGTVEDDAYGYITKYGSTGDYILAAGIDIAPGNILDDFQAYIARIKGTDGSIIWVDTFGIITNGTNDAFQSNAIVLDNGDIVGIGVTHFSSSGGGLDAWLVKYDGNGNRLWKRTFNKNGGNNHHYFWDVQPTTDNGFVICGDLTNFALSEQNMWVLKLDSMGCEIANCSVGVEEEEIVLNATVKVYPNPATGIVTIQYDATTFTNSMFRLFDVMGKEMLYKKIESNHTQLDVSLYPKGVYFYQITNSIKSYSGKLIVQ